MINNYIFYFDIWIFKKVTSIYCIWIDALDFSVQHFPCFNDNFMLNFDGLVMVIKIARSAYNLAIRSEWYFTGEQNESWPFRNYENQDMVMVIMVKPCRHVDTPEVGFVREKRAGNTAQKVKTLWKFELTRRFKTLAVDAAIDNHSAFAAFEGESRLNKVASLLQVSGRRARFISRSQLCRESHKHFASSRSNGRDQTEDWRNGMVFWYKIYGNSILLKKILRKKHGQLKLNGEKKNDFKVQF